MGRVCYIIAISDGDITSLRNREDDVEEYVYSRYCTNNSAEETRDSINIDKAWKVLFDVLDVLAQQESLLKKAYQANMFQQAEWDRYLMAEEVAQLWPVLSAIAPADFDNAYNRVGDKYSRAYAQWGFNEMVKAFHKAYIRGHGLIMVFH